MFKHVEKVPGNSHRNKDGDTNGETSLLAKYLERRVARVVHHRIKHDQPTLPISTAE